MYDDAHNDGLFEVVGIVCGVGIGIGGTRQKS